jgi:hypothetical protein
LKIPLSMTTRGAGSNAGALPSISRNCNHFLVAPPHVLDFGMLLLITGIFSGANFEPVTAVGRSRIYTLRFRGQPRGN